MGQSVLESSVAVESATTSPLVLGHCNGPKVGEVVQLTRPKCYLGAGSLTANHSAKPNLAGVHCLILRGPERTVVRRWSPAARLNGRPFAEATLSVGDRLQLGGIELEVLADASEGTLAQWRVRLGDRDESRRMAREAAIGTREEELARRAAALERTEHELQQKTEQLSRLAEELNRRQVLLDGLATEACARENEANRRTAANEQLRLELDSQAQALEQALQTLKEQRNAIEIAQENAAHQHRAHVAAWEIQRAAEAAILDARESALAEAESRLAERTAMVASVPQPEALQAELAQQRQSFQQDREHLEKLRAELDGARRELTEQKESLLNDQRRQQEVETAHALRKTLLDQSGEESTRQLEELAQQRKRLETDIRSLREERSAFESAQQSAAQTQADLQANKDEAHSAADEDLQRRHRELAEWQQQIAECERQFEERLAVYAAERVEFAARREQCDEQLRQLEARQQELAASERDIERQRTALERKTAECEQRRDHISKQERHLADRAVELDELGAKQTALLDVHREELKRSQTNFAAEYTVRQRELQENRATLEMAQREYKNFVAQIEQQRAELASRQATLDEQLAELKTNSAGLSERQRRLEEQQQSLEQRERSIAERESAAERLAASTTASTEVEEAPVAPAPPESTEEVFRRLGVLSLLRKAPQEQSECACEAESPESSSSEEASVEPVAEPPAQAAEATAPIDLDEGDEAQVIERYMSQLLGRMRSGKTETPPAPAPAKTAKTPSPMTAETADTIVAAAETMAPVEVSRQPTPPAAPRAQHPSSRDLSAMRQLANESAQAAIDAHTRQLLLNDLYVKIIIGLTAIVSGIVLFSWTPQIGWLGLLGGAGCFVGAAAWGVKIGQVCRAFLNASGVTEQDDHEPAAEEFASTTMNDVQPELSDKAN